MRALPFAVVVSLAVASTSHARAQDSDPWISRDKAFHFDVSAGVAAVGYAGSAAYLVDARWKALALGGGAAIALGAAKEGWDALGYGDPSWKDFAWDVVGAVAGLAIAWGMDLALGGVDRDHPALGSPRAAIRF